MLILKSLAHADIIILNQNFIIEQLKTPKIFNYHAPFWNGTEYVITWYEPIDADYFAGEALGGSGSDQANEI